jgi:hypothetical protein
LWIRAFIAEDMDGVGVEGSGDTTTVDVQTHLEAFMEKFQTWSYLHQLL